MILYVNGDDHTSAAGAANDFAFANSDIRFVAQGRRPHPDNLDVSWGMRLSKKLGLGLKCDAESGSSNDRIYRTTFDFIKSLKLRGKPYTVAVIGWTTWEREEWYDEESREWLQVTASGTDTVPDKWQTRYRQYIAGLDYKKKETEAHSRIHDLHMKLYGAGIPHLFFNAMWHFSGYQDNKTDWHDCYLSPYDPELCYSEWASLNGFGTRDQHYGPEAHSAWAEVLAKRLTPLLETV